MKSNPFGERPATSRDWRGEEVPIDWPKGTVIARCLDVWMIKLRKYNSFAVVYGLDVKEGIAWDEAALVFGQSCMHQAECLGLK